MQKESLLITPATGYGKTSSLEIRSSSLAFGILSLVLCCDMLAGPLRYYLFKVGLGAFIYLPKALCLFFVIHELVLKPVQRTSLYIFAFLAFYAVVGFLHQVGPLTELFTVYLVAPFLFGAVAAHYFYEKENKLVTLMFALFAITAVGVGIDIFIDFPWKGFVYSVGGTDIEGSREWTTMGFERVAGFARMSADTAFYLVCSGLFLYSYLESMMLKIPVLFVALPAVLATTNKAGIGGLILGVASIWLARHPRLLKFAVYGLAAVVVLLPLSTVLRKYDMNLADPISLILLASFEDRLTSTWPDFFTAVGGSGNSLTGVGFGGIGSALKYFGGSGFQRLAVADNFALYLYGAFGVAAVALFYYFARMTVELFASPDRVTKAMAPVMVSLLAASLTTDVIEAQVFAVMLGIALVFSHQERLIAPPARSADKSPACRPAGVAS